MATASGKAEGRQRPLMPLVAYGVVLLLLVAAVALVVLAGGGKGAGRESTAQATAPAAPDPRTARALKLPPRPATADKASPEKPSPDKLLPDKPATESPPPEKATPATALKPEPLAVAGASAPAEAAKKPEPPKSECKVDLSRWPSEKSDQAQAIQMILRDLGYYRGTTNGTVGPQTRTAIREFQTASGEGETGEITESLFEALKKKCAASP